VGFRVWPRTRERESQQPARLGARRCFFRFWYDFLVGDRPELFVGPIVALAVAWLATRADVPAAVTGILLFGLVTAVGGLSIGWAVRG
jgi:hypothetical protein